MIQVKESEPPIILSENETELCEKDCRAYDENREDYQNDIEKFKFNRNIYSHHKEVAYKELESAMKPTAKYSGMAIDNLES